MQYSDSQEHSMKKVQVLFLMDWIIQSYQFRTVCGFSFQNCELPWSSQFIGAFISIGYNGTQNICERVCVHICQAPQCFAYRKNKGKLAQSQNSIPSHWVKQIGNCFTILSCCNKSLNHEGHYYVCHLAEKYHCYRKGIQEADWHYSRFLVDSTIVL